MLIVNLFLSYSTETTSPFPPYFMLLLQLFDKALFSPRLYNIFCFVTPIKYSDRVRLAFAWTPRDIYFS